ncbi:MAG TPA: hypothetical protein VK084_04540 [Chitinophagaceae bacterium]|nr:hypothetical protein [Chitinophagaceae bacterium]
MQLSTKRIMKYLFTMSVLIAAITMFAGCSSNDDDVPNPDGDGNGSNTNPIEISSDIISDTVLTDRGDGVDYIFCGGIIVKAALTIDPGVKIAMCADANIWVEDEGSFYAVGTEDAPIIIEGKEHTKGYWGNIDFRTNDPDNQIAYAQIRDGGGNGGSDAIIYLTSINNAQLSLTHTTIANSKKIGLHVDFGGATLSDFVDNHFKDNGTYPVQIPLNRMGQLDAATDYGDHNGKNLIATKNGDDLNKDMTIPAANVPYFIDQFWNVKEGITLKPGTHFVMGSEAAIVIEDDGFLNAEGTAEDSISIVGKVDAAGYWNSITFQTNNPKNVMKYVTISNGGSDAGYSDHSSIYVNGLYNAQLILQHSTIRDSYSWGLYVDDGATITPGSVSDLEDTNTFTNNGTGTDADCDGDCNVLIE